MLSMLVVSCVVDEGRLTALFKPSFCQTHYMWFGCIESDLEVGELGVQTAAIPKKNLEFFHSQGHEAGMPLPFLFLDLGLIGGLGCFVVTVVFIG